MAVRERPFCEWVIVYLDPKRTDVEKIEERLREKGCPRAKRDVVPAKTVGDVTAEVDDPVVTPGDCVLVAVSLPENREGRALIVPPERWHVRAGKQVRITDGEVPTMLSLQTTRETPAGEHSFSVRAEVGDQNVTLEQKVEVVRKV